MNKLDHLDKRGNPINEKQEYMNIKTGAVDNYNGWWYQSDDSGWHNAVDLGEVVPVLWDETTDS